MTRNASLPQRRAFLGALASLPASAAAASAYTPENVAKTADTLARAMARLHGGQWLVTVDHEAGFILIRPKPVRSKGGAA